MSISKPERVWWRPVDREEKLWITIALIWALILFLMMPYWHVKGKQNPSQETYKVTPTEFLQKANEFIEQYKVGVEKGIPVVEPPPGSDIYLIARMWSWSPILKLKKGETYRLHVSSLDLQHGFSVYPINMNFMVLPNYDYVLTITPTEEGEYTIICNEYCGLGHHLMVGKILVES